MRQFLHIFLQTQKNELNKEVLVGNVFKILVKSGIDKCFYMLTCICD